MPELHYDEANWKPSHNPWLVALTVTLVLVAEMINTVVEAVVDLVSPTYHPLARVAKDVAAGAVLVTAIGSVVVGLFIFLPYLLPLRRP